jgi:hypothetical protein
MMGDYQKLQITCKALGQLMTQEIRLIIGGKECEY